MVDSLELEAEKLDRAIELDPTDASNYTERGRVRLAQEDCGRAIDDFTKAIELDPGDASAHTGRAWAKSFVDDLDGAIADLQQVSVLAPDDLSVHEKFSVHLLVRGEDRAFVKVMTRTVEMGCDSAQGLRWLAWIQATSTDPEARNDASALALARRAAVQQPRTGEFQMTLGVACYRNGLWAEACRALQRSVDLGFEYAGILFCLAMAEKRLGNARKAERVFHRAVALRGVSLLDDEITRRFRSEAEEVLGLKSD